jgi:hypothetical protein
MKQPTDDEIERLLMHWGTYNPIQAHQYYEQHKHLKGRKKGHGHVTSARRNAAHHPNRNSARHKQKIHLQNRIENLQSKLGQLEAMIHKKEAILRKDQAHAKGKAHKKKDTPKTAAQKGKGGSGEQEVPAEASLATQGQSQASRQGWRRTQVWYWAEDEPEVDRRAQGARN